MKKTTISVFCTIFFIFTIYAQIDKYNTMDFHPSSPTAFQFSKYWETPVSEYTGTAQISVPIYSIKVDGLTIPIALNYQAQGIRVSQEASWVGLGWDLAFGCIVQHINDRDDLGEHNLSPTGQNIRLMPDFYWSGAPNPFTLPYEFDEYGRQITNNTNTTINPTSPNHGYGIVHDFQLPVNGSFAQKQADLFDNEWMDSEPDIFIASVLGETVKFIYDPNHSPMYVVLNKAGYDINKAKDGFEIINPSGHHFFFEEKKYTENITYSSDILNSITHFGGAGNAVSTSGTLAPIASNGGTWEKTTNYYYLSKIITKNNQLINFNYYKTPVENNYPAYNTKLQSLNRTSTTIILTNSASTESDAFGDLIPNANFIAETYSISRESQFYLSSIEFPSGVAIFQLGDRNDIQGGKKLEKILLYDKNNTLVNNWTLTYSYFDATGDNSQGYSSPLIGSNLMTDQISLLRLKLLGLQNNDGTYHEFEYNANQLPRKNSYSQDFWGYYNGNNSTSFVPQVTGLNTNVPSGFFNNRNASLNHTIACTLAKMKIPTGGIISYNFELNEFPASDMIGIPTSTTTIKGAGIRIKKIILFDGIKQQPTKISEYLYEGGKYLNQTTLFRNLTLKDYSPMSTPFQAESSSYDLKEVSANGFFELSPLAGNTSVGYNKVIVNHQSFSNHQNGSQKFFFSNNYYKNTNRSVYAFARNCLIPAYKDESKPENGTLLSEKTYDANDVLVKEIENKYDIITSEYFYGARLFNFFKRLSRIFDDGGTPQNLFKNLQLVGFYPIFDFETRLKETITTEYDKNNKSLTHKKTFDYDAFGQYVGGQDYTSEDGGWTETIISRPGNFYPQNQMWTRLMNTHRYDEIMSQKILKRPYNYNPPRDISSMTKEYDYFSGKFLTSKISTTTYKNSTLTNNIPSVTQIIDYDNYGNLKTFLTPDGITTDYIWDYNGQYLIAETKIGKTVSDPKKLTAYSSFEYDGSGNWSYSHSSVVVNPNAPDGNHTYRLSSPLNYLALNTSAAYKVSLWANSSNFTVLINNNVTNPTYQGETKNGFTYYEFEITGNITDISISGVNTTEIDAVRLYPKGGLMTTFLYKPLVGIISETNPQGKTIYYEYDNFNRLKLIKDKDGNIIKTFEYKYLEQQ